MSESKSLLARLLAKENISVQHGNYRTAYFDVKNRILGLPLWKDNNKDLYDMLVGHEVGHALFTPAEGWGDAQTGKADVRVPGDYLNVVEDIRIERLIQETYPGMVRSFKGGYTYLHESDFFEIGDRDINTLSLMDRINVKAKLRDLVDVTFSDAEQPLVDKAFKTNTWDDVVAVAGELYEWVKNQTEDDEENPAEQSMSRQVTEQLQNDDNDEDEDPTSGQSGDVETQESPEEDGDDDRESETNSGEADSNGDNEGDQEQQKADDRATNDTPEDFTDEEVETYRNAMKNSDQLLDTNSQGDLPIVVNGFHRWQMMERIVPFEKVSASRERYKKERIEKFSSPHYDEKLRKQILENMNTDAKYKEFLTQTKRIVNIMVKEFETRKAAYQYSKASVSRSGELDLDKLHQYKTSDDIFRRTTHLADAKSHGMVMLLDNSRSMDQVRGPVITQVLNLAMFCKRVNIPFDVYSFTNGVADESELTDQGKIMKKADYVNYRPMEELDHTSTQIVHMLSSSFSKKNYEKGYRQLFDLTVEGSGANGLYDRMSGTPLNNILTGMHLLIKDFKRKHSIQKPIFTVLTDGASSELSVNPRLANLARAEKRKGLRINLAETKKPYHICKSLSSYGSSSVDMTQGLLNAIQSEISELTTLGYFVANDNEDFRSAVFRVTGYSSDALAEARKSVRDKKFISYDNVIGYDRYFILKGGDKNSLEAKDDEFKIPSKAKRNEIRNAFKKFSKSKKGNRILATQFAEIVS